MRITGKGTIYKNNYGYSITDNQKNMDGTYTNYYVSVRFQKGLEIPEDRSFVSIEGYTSPYKNKDGIDKMSYFITSCVVISKKENANNTQYPKEDMPQEIYAEQERANQIEADEIVLTDDDLPF